MLIKQHAADLIGTFATAFLDDFLGGANNFERAKLFVACIVDMFLQLGVCFQLSKSQLFPVK